MIHFNDVRIGNWISLAMPGSLISAHRILDKDEDKFCVSIDDGTEYTLCKIDERWTYEKQPKTRLSYPEELKGIPLSVEILTSCGFQLTPHETLTNQTSTESSVTTYYSLQDFTVMSSGSIRTYMFTDKTGNARIQFVHELQNLYFKSMNKELDITVPAFNFQLMSKGI